MTENGQDRYSVHKEPVWRDLSDFIINAPLDEPGRFEQLWCRQLSETTFELCCIPFFLYDVALGDVVETLTHEGRRYAFGGVVRPSGRYVFRVYFAKENRGRRDEVVLALTELGALIEWSSASMVAVDARDAEHAQQVAHYLWAEESQGRLIYETGKTA